MNSIMITLAALIAPTDFNMIACNHPGCDIDRQIERLLIACDSPDCRNDRQIERLLIA